MTSRVLSVLGAWTLLQDPRQRYPTEFRFTAKVNAQHWVFKSFVSGFAVTLGQDLCPAPPARTA